MIEVVDLDAYIQGYGGGWHFLRGSASII